MTQSLPPSYFDAIYRSNPDPWKFATSQYEADKYAVTLAALPKMRYRSGFEIGGSIGVLTEKLAPRCDALLSVDVSDIAQSQAIQRCRSMAQIQFQIMRLPEEYPDQMFDLILLSEVGYYWCWEDLSQVQNRIAASLEPSGHLLLVHWTQPAPEYPLTGDEVHNSFLAMPQLIHLHGLVKPEYRLDLFTRTA